MARPRARAKRQYGDGGITQNKKTNEWFVWVPLGHGKRRAVRAADEADARQKHVELLKQRDAGIDFAGARLTLEAFLTQWFNREYKRRVKPSTAANAKQRLQLYVLPDLGDARLEELKRADIVDWLNALQDEGYAASTIRGTYYILADALDAAMKDDYVLRNVVRLVHRPALTTKPARPLSPPETRQLLSALQGDRLEALYHLAVLLGRRRGECLGLRWPSVDLNNLQFTIAEQTQEFGGVISEGTLKSKDSVRTLPLTEQLADVFQTHQRRQAAHKAKRADDWTELQLVFPSDVGTRMWPRNLIRDFKWLLDDAGLPHEIRFHDLRHTAATRLREVGADELLIGAFLGHSKTSVTQAYIQLHIREMRAKVEQVERLIL